MKCSTGIQAVSLSCLAAATLAAFPAAAQTADSTTSVVVTGQKAAARKAQEAQAAANNVLSVISADDIGALPDKNAAEALARMPGVSVQRDQGEGRYVVIRGLGPDLNSVTINGTLVPAPEASRRGVALDTLPAGMVRALEVSKTLTPDRDANSIGGTIEVKTLSAFDVPGALSSFGLGVSHDEVTGRVSPNGNLLIARRFDAGRIGVAFGLSSERREFGSDNVETGGAWTGNRLTGFELRDYLPNRERHALSVSLDWRPDSTRQLYLRAFASQFSDSEVRDRLTIGNVANAAATPGGAFAEGQSVTARAERRLRQRKYTQEIQSVVVGGEAELAGWGVSAVLGLGQANEDTPESINDARFRQNNVAGVSFINSRAPLLSGPASLLLPASYALNGFTLQQRYSEDTEQNVRLDLKRGWGADFEWKLGLKGSRREKTNDTNQWAYNSSNATSPNFWGAGPTTMAAFVGPDVVFPLGSIGPGIDQTAVRARLGNLPRDPARLARESTFNDYRMNEDISASYLQASWDPRPGLNVLVGARNERTDFTAVGSQISPTGTVSPLRVERNESRWLPGVHSRWDVDRQTTVRAAWWNALVRANFSQLAPGVNLSSPTEATIGNPDLKPLRAANLDLGVERLLGRDGQLSAYAFSKDIRDFTYTTNLAGTGAWAAYTSAVSFANGGPARVSGVELSYQQALRTLPGWASGLIAGVNATVTSSRAEVSRFDRTTNAVVKRTIRLPGQSDQVFNLILGYEQGPVSARLALNQKSAYLLELGDILNPAQDRMVDRQRQLDISVSWQFNRRVQMVFEAINLNDEKYYVYQGSRELNAQYEQYGRTLRVGMKVSLF